MNCKDIEMLMADALGDELSLSDRPVFEDHLAVCDRCREEFETARATVATMRALPGPQRVSIHREGNRLVIEDRQAPAVLPFAGVSRWAVKSWRSGILRYAAGLFVAFAAGYWLHAGSTPTEVDGTVDSGAPVTRRVAPGDTPSDSLQRALASAHARNPARSDLAKCLIALSGSRP